MLRFKQDKDVDVFMPIHKAKNEDFFKKWSSEMAYVLGFFTADGSMYTTKRGTHFLDFQITDKALLGKIRESLGSDHKISIRRRGHNRKTVYRLQIGSKSVFLDLLNLGLTPNKSNTIKLPDIPRQYFSDFVRGYFDGDGNVVFGFFKKSDRRNLTRTVCTRFTAGSRSILESMQKRLRDVLGTTGSLCFYSDAWRLNYSLNDSVKLCNFMYKSNQTENLIYLERKYNIYQNAGVA